VKLAAVIGCFVCVLGAVFFGLAAVQGARADGWCMSHRPRSADGYGVRWGWLPPSWECTYTQVKGERIIEIGRVRVFSE
jgi:hypothetical protein